MVARRKLTSQNIILGLWVLISATTIGGGEIWQLTHRFHSNPDRVQLWLSFSYAIMFAAIGNLIASPNEDVSKRTKWMWTVFLLIVLVFYVVFAVRTLLPAIMYDVPLEQLTADTMWMGRTLKVAVVLLIGKLSFESRRSIRR